jgi:CubicO group peptidase (beta-lactamase class C family)
MLPIDRLHELVASKREAYHVPGIAAGVVLGDDLAWFAGDGWADLETRISPTERSLARVGSVTKTFTATAVLQLKDRGQLELDDPLERHLPEFGQARERGGRRDDVTIRRLLTHRSGLVTESPPTSWAAPWFPSMTEVLDALPETGVVAPPDLAGKYSNLGFGLLGEVVTRLSGRPHADYVRAAMFDPLGLADATFEPDAGARRLLMTGYSPGAHEDRPSAAPNARLNGLAAAGQLYASVRDLATWVSFQIRGTGRAAGGHEILRPGTLAESQRPLYVEPDLKTGQCLAWRVTRVGEHVFHNHGGSVHGFNSSVGYHLPSGIGVIVLANLWPTTVAADLALELLETIVGTPGARPKQPASLPPGPAPAAIRPFLGRYRAEPGIDADLEWRDSTLHLLSPAGAFPLHTPAVLEPMPNREGAFRFATGRAAGEETRFIEDAETGTTSFEIGGFVYRGIR